MSIHEQLTTALSYFGLQQTDAMVYLGLLQMGSVTVGTMSAKLDIDRGKAYRSLNKLRNLGLITTTFSNPTIYKAIEPKEGLTTIMQRREDEIITMQKLSRKIVDTTTTNNKTRDCNGDIIILHNPRTCQHLRKNWQADPGIHKNNLRCQNSGGHS